MATNFIGKRQFICEVEYAIGDRVYDRTSSDLRSGIVTAIVLKPNDILYTVSFTGSEVNMHSLELSSTPEYVLN